MVTVTRARSVVLVVIASMAAWSNGACSAPAEPAVRAAAVYESVVRWFTERSDDDPEPLAVFVEPRGEGTAIDLEIQAEVVASTADAATVTFTDTRDEALATDDDGTVVVADNGVLIRLGPVDEEGRAVRLDVDVHDGRSDDGEDRFRTLQFTLRTSGDRWVVAGEPQDITSAP